MPVHTNSTDLFHENISEQKKGNSFKIRLVISNKTLC